MALQALHQGQMVLLDLLHIDHRDARWPLLSSIGSPCHIESIDIIADKGFRIGVVEHGHAHLASGERGLIWIIGSFDSLCIAYIVYTPVVLGSIALVLAL